MSKLKSYTNFIDQQDYIGDYFISKVSVVNDPKSEHHGQPVFLVQNIVSDARDCWVFQELIDYINKHEDEQS